MTQETKHTPLPYKVVTGGDNIDVQADSRKHIARCGRRWSAKESFEKANANAEFIVRACNSHYDLLEAAKLLGEYAEAYLPFSRGNIAEADAIKNAIAAIAKAKDTK